MEETPKIQQKGKRRKMKRKETEKKKIDERKDRNFWALLYVSCIYANLHTFHWRWCSPAGSSHSCTIPLCWRTADQDKGLQPHTHSDLQRKWTLVARMCVWILFMHNCTCALPADECVSRSTWDTAIRSHSVHTHLAGTLRHVSALVHIWTSTVTPHKFRTNNSIVCGLHKQLCLLTCAGVVLQLETMAAHAAVTPHRVLTAAVGAGSLLALINVCTQMCQRVSSDPLLTRTTENILLNLAIN